MMRTILCSILALGLLMACGDEAYTPVTPDSSRISTVALNETDAAVAGHVQDTTELTFPMTLVADVPCADDGRGDVIQCDYMVTFTIHEVVTPAGVTVEQSVIDTEPIGLAVGLTTGRTYEDTTPHVGQVVAVYFDGENRVFTNNQKIRYVDQLTGHVYQFGVVYHFTINANGELATEHIANRCIGMAKPQKP